MAPRFSEVDYSLYLVTDSTRAILGSRDLVAVVEAAVKGGAGIVQYRDKSSDTAELIRTAQELHNVTRQHGVPLLINDRVDVALAIGCEGVHIGQDDMSLATARKLLGPDAIIGVTANTVQEALDAARGGADYLGIGTVYATPTKKDTKTIIGTAGVQAVLSALHTANFAAVDTVAIGGINSANARRVLYQSKSSYKSLSGIAVVSAVMAAEDPRSAAADLKKQIARPFPFAQSSAVGTLPKEVSELLKSVPSVCQRLARSKPICHNMTNLVVQNFAANVALAIGGSPIMSNQGREAPDLARLDGSLVINMGTVTPDMLENYKAALAAYNVASTPVLFDPVGGGATAVRRDAIKALLSAGYFTVIKGNENEIQAVIGQTNTVQRGVDSSSSLTDKEKAGLVKELAAREGNVVVMTGSRDFVSDGNRVFVVSNGHPYLGGITGSGCSLGTTIAACTAVERTDVLLAALTGLLMYEIAAERAAARDDCKGPGTFVPAFIDELAAIRDETSASNTKWLQNARVEHFSTA